MVNMNIIQARKALSLSASIRNCRNALTSVRNPHVDALGRKILLEDAMHKAGETLKQLDAFYKEHRILGWIIKHIDQFPKVGRYHRLVRLKLQMQGLVPVVQKHSLNHEVLFHALHRKTMKTMGSQFKNEDFCKVANRFAPDAEGTRCIAKTHVTFPKGRPNNVHANHVHLHATISPVICSQAPLLDVEEEFWTLVIGQSRLIVDLTNAKDRKEQNVHEYYPDKDIGFMMGKVQVRVQHADRGKGEITYETELHGMPSKEVERLHFAQWPDFGIISVDELEELVNRISEKRATHPDEPVWIHCRAGVGRTGVVTVALAIQQYFAAGHLNAFNYQEIIDGFILTGRAQRDIYFVQNNNQYKLLLEYAEKLLKE